MCMRDTLQYTRGQRVLLEPAEPCVGHSKGIPNKPKPGVTSFRNELIEVEDGGVINCIKHQNYSVELQSESTVI